MSKSSETKAWGPILDALPFGQKLFDKRRKRLMPLTRQMRHRLGLHLLLIDPTGSMSPMIVGGDLVLLYERPKDIRVGDVVGFSTGNWFVGHRVIHIEEVDGEKRYYTKGDSVPKQDPGYRTLEQIEGRVIHIFRPPLLQRYFHSDYFWRKFNYADFRRRKGEPFIPVD